MVLKTTNIIKVNPPCITNENQKVIKHLTAARMFRGMQQTDAGGYKVIKKG